MSPLAPAWRPRSGLTLVELLVALALSAIITTMVVQLLLFAHKAWIRSDQRSTTLQNALVVLTRVREEVRDANPDSIVCIPSTGTDASGRPVAQDAVLLVSWRIWDATELLWDPSGQILWQSILAIYLDPATSRVMLRQRLLPAAVVDPPTLTPADFTPQPGDVVHVVAQNIDSLSLTRQGPTVVGVSVQAGTGQNDCLLDGSAMTTVPSAGSSPSH